ncbi:MAG: UDP-N-acetylmuramate--L-alanine ligase [Chloroflexi bacterium]|nr:UDP-N-acetylmuramate--L-alanine ligase [Chloroflexota bacterium]
MMENSSNAMPRRVHMVGIGGAGMSALARLYLQQGTAVSGSDESDSATLHDLASVGATVHVGHNAAYVGTAGLVVYSSAVPETKPELVEARRRGIRTLKHAQALAELFNPRRGIAVAGTHGKTTTSSMIAYALVRCGRQPSFHVGGELVDLNTSARWGDGEWMVIEADEFDRRFLEYTPDIAVVLNVEPDHFEYYGTVVAMEAAFAAFLERVRPGGRIVACGDSPRLAPLLENVRDRHVVRYGLDPGRDEPRSAGSAATRSSGGWAPDRSSAHPERVEGRSPAGFDWWAEDVREVPGGSRFTACRRAAGGDVERVRAALAIPGRHNVSNALAALAVCATVGVPAQEAADALAGFHGARRRFQLMADPADAGGVRVYDDYAHHPTEVRAMVAAARPLVPPEGRLWTVFQPHLYVRTEELFDEFACAFDGADRVVLTDVYSPSGREPARNYRGSRELAAAIPDARHAPTLDDARRLLLDEVRPGDIVLVMGAGPITQLASRLADDLKRRTKDGTDDNGS